MRICAPSKIMLRRTFLLRSNVQCAIERSAFERTSCVRTHSVEFLPINKTLGHLVEGGVLGGVFGEHFAPPLLVPPILFVSFYFIFNFNALFHFNYALFFNG
jgi:hypothetical protein